MFSTFRKSLLSVIAAVAVFALFGLAPLPAHAVPALSNFLGNKLIDFVLRGQAYTPPTTVFVALATTTGSPAACGTEVTGGSYARVAVTTSLTNFSGTQGAGTTAVSSGTNTGTGLTFSNNAAVTFPAPTASWGTVVEFCVFDASTAGNLLFRAALSSSQTINSGAAAPSFSVSALTGTVN
jgi:hypothetical protein